ncbi:hypothetical protein Hdeb2414_s0009g00314261 [Helianthus debilis subsp. tardiflorus]
MQGNAIASLTHNAELSENVKASSTHNEEISHHKIHIFQLQLEVQETRFRVGYQSVMYSKVTICNRRNQWWKKDTTITPPCSCFCSTQKFGSVEFLIL